MKIKPQSELLSGLSPSLPDHRETLRLTKFISEHTSEFWEQVKHKQTLRLFHRASRHVPAYRDFLLRHKIDPIKVKTIKDLSVVPPITKDNYLRAYPLEDLTWSGSLTKPLVYTATSGSTGDPVYFHRSQRLDWQSSILHEMYYALSPQAAGSTLVVVCFGMGVWIGGLITYQAFRLMQERGYPISTITPGINKEEIFKALKNLAPHYQRVLLVGYAPFIKDVVDEAPEHDIDIRKLNLRLLFAAEPFSEDFRDYITRQAHLSTPYLDTANIYGSADLGTMAMETPLAILVRRLCRKHHPLFNSLFQNIEKTPTLAQYIPSFISFEAEAGNLIITGDNSLPLVRYSIGDHGGVYSFNELGQKLAATGVDLWKEAKAVGLDQYWQELPFVYVYERADFSTTLYGLQVYPEPIRDILLKKPLSNYLTGKFNLETTFDQDQDQHLSINLELRKNRSIPPSIKRVILKRVVDQLDAKNAEYRELHKFLGKRAFPVLTFWSAEDPKYFKPGIKQKWVKK